MLKVNNKQFKVSKQSLQTLNKKIRERQTQCSHTEKLQVSTRGAESSKWSFYVIYEYATLQVHAQQVSS